MRIYVAAKFEKKDMVRAMYAQIRALGHEITYDWTTHKFIEPYVEHEDIAQKYAENELAGIAACDVLIFISDEHGTTLPMEFGAASLRCFMTGKPIVYVVGEWNTKSPWFFASHVRRRETIEEVLKELTKTSP
ncbi:hypothetical protein HY624_00890 [Candidatus Uhrbacteria bacterium]|nr:hypothetical protein [Candidatus Uhrbacteria bacterium]